MKDGKFKITTGTTEAGQGYTNLSYEYDEDAVEQRVKDSEFMTIYYKPTKEQLDVLKNISGALSGIALTLLFITACQFVVCACTVLK